MKEFFQFKDLAKYNICSNLFVYFNALSSRTISYAKIMLTNSQF